MKSYEEYINSLNEGVSDWNNEIAKVKDDVNSHFIYVNPKLDYMTNEFNGVDIKSHIKLKESNVVYVSKYQMAEMIRGLQSNKNKFIEIHKTEDDSDSKTIMVSRSDKYNDGVVITCVTPYKHDVVIYVNNKQLPELIKYMQTIFKKYS